MPKFQIFNFSKYWNSAKVYENKNFFSSSISKKFSNLQKIIFSKKIIYISKKIINFSKKISGGEGMRKFMIFDVLGVVINFKELRKGEKRIKRGLSVIPVIKKIDISIFLIEFFPSLSESLKKSNFNLRRIVKIV